MATPAINSRTVPLPAIRRLGLAFTCHLVKSGPRLVAEVYHDVSNNDPRKIQDVNNVEARCAGRLTSLHLGRTSGGLLIAVPVQPIVISAFENGAE